MAFFLLEGVKLEILERNCSREALQPSADLAGWRSIPSVSSVVGSLCRAFLTVFSNAWLQEDSGMEQLRSEVWLFWGVQFGGILYLGCCGLSRSFWHWISPLLFRKGLQGNLNMRRKVKLLIWQLEIVCAVLCPRTEHTEAWGFG